MMIPDELTSFLVKGKGKEANYKNDVIRDYWICVLSREVSITARKEVLLGRANFGITGSGKEIAQVAREWGAQVPFIRPTELAQDDSTQISVVTHAIRWLESHEHIQPNYVMLLQPTSPLRTAEDIVAAIEIAKTRDAIAVVSVCPAVHHPYLTKRVLEDGTLDDFMPDHLTDLRRQVLPPVYTLNGAIYLNRRESLLHDRMFLPQGTCAYIMPPERSLDIDSPWDFYLADLILRDNYEHRIP